MGYVASLKSKAEEIRPGRLDEVNEARDKEIKTLHEVNEARDKEIKELKAVVKGFQAADGRGAGGPIRQATGPRVRRVLVMGEYVYGINIGGGWKKPPLSGHYGITGQPDNFKVKMYTRAQQNDKNRYHDMPLPWDTARLYYTFPTLNTALMARDKELKCLNLRVVTRDDGSYRVEPVCNI